jgi:hypothetical protein
MLNSRILQRLYPPRYGFRGVWASPDDIDSKAFAGLLGSADFSPANSYERNFDAATPRVLVLAFTLPTQIEETA